ELLLQRARSLGIEAASDEEAVERLLEREVRTPAPTDAECCRYYDGHAERFRVGELAEVRHVLYAVAPGAPVALIRARAEATLAQLRSGQGDFAELARAESNCPSAAHGGNLGQLSRGAAVAEFDQAVFGNAHVGVMPFLVRTRHGFHVVEVVRRVEGRQLPFEAVRERIAVWLEEHALHRALAQYVQLLAGEAELEGVDLMQADSPLVQ
ncbi:MAG TPA: peptidylprolyl isomerase, partial [Pelomicrobium sp.]|nr:peptidylprolyl isomerase [Pelomicrobium sp.]